MPLISLWNSYSAAIEELSIEQIVATAGDGFLKDNSACSKELTEYFSQITSERLGLYTEQCLFSKFEKGGFVLQDLVNELGRRLDYSVTNGRYQGVTGLIGYDGLWRSPEGSTVIVKVKTTDAYRVSLDTLAGYRQRLLKEGTLEGEPTILIVVGRQDTGELEAQIRGSRHAWDIRLISVEALTKLVSLKINSDDSETGTKIRSILVPVEYSRLDRLVDVLFTTAAETSPESIAMHVEVEEEIEVSQVGEVVPVEFTSISDGGSSWEFTDTLRLQKKRQIIVDAMVTKVGAALIKKSRALFWSTDHSTRIACTISKRYLKRSTYPYWYAFHPQWDRFLGEVDNSFLVLGCMDLEIAFSIPHAIVEGVLPYLNTTDTDKGKYWHIHITGGEDSGFEIMLPKHSDNLKISDYKLSLI